MKKSPLKVGLIDCYKRKSKGYDAITKLIPVDKGIIFERITLEKLVNTPDLKKKFNVLWWHYDEDVNLPETEYDYKIKNTLLDFTNSGGGVLLSLLAAQYIYDLGLEDKPPQVIYKGQWEKISWIEDFPDIRGFQGFRNHHIFKDSFNGVYTWNPQKGEDYCEVYYTEKNNMNLRKSVAVGRGYISLEENLSLINEYQNGKGKILTIGSCFSFTPLNNRFQSERILFTINCLNYLGKNIGGIENTYWPDKEFELIKLKDEKTKYRFNKQDFSISHSDLNFSGKSGDNYFDLSGMKALLMGKENGGISEIWFHPFRAIKDFHFFFTGRDGKMNKDSEINSRCIVQPESIHREYEIKGTQINETIFSSREKAGAAINYEIKPGTDFNLIFKYNIDFRYMWPYSANLISPIKYYWDKGLKCLVVMGLEDKFSVVFGSPNDPISIGAEIIPNESGKIKNGEKESKQVCFSIKFSFKKKDVCCFPVVISGSDLGVKESIDTYKSLISNLQFYYKDQFNYYKNLIANCCLVETPDIEFNAGYKWAIIGTDKFFGETRQLGKSFFAGFNLSRHGWGDGRPGYAWYFGRDSVWVSFAALKYGVFDKAKNVIEFLGKYQNIEGKIFHEITTSGCIHYDAADSTPLYIILCGYYLKATGDLKFIKKEWVHIQKAIDFCFSTDTDKDHLIENTNVGHGWIEGGYLWPQHSEAYLTACWAEALNEAGYITDHLRLRDVSLKYKKESRKVKNIFNEKFWNSIKQIYSVGKKQDGTFTNEGTSLIAVPLLFDLGDISKAMKTLYEFAGSNFSSDWGVRMMREDNKEFKPTGYHYGAVWPLFTGWVSLAEYRYSRGVQGFTHLMNNLSLYKFWAKGYIQEVLNGEDFQPSGVCSHQAWSESMVIQPVLEGMLGIRTDALNNQLMLNPNFPADWDDVRVKNIRIGTEKIDFQFLRTKDKYLYRISKKSKSNIKIKFIPFLMKETDINFIRINNKRTVFDIEILDDNLKCILDLNLKNNSEIEIDYSGGINVLPYIPKLHIGSKSKGLRIISDKFIKNEYRITIEGKREHEYDLRVYSNGIKIDTIEGGEIISKVGNIYNISISFEDSKEKYYEKELVLKFK